MLTDKTYRVNLIMYPATLQKYFRNGLKNAKKGSQFASIHFNKALESCARKPCAIHTDPDYRLTRLQV